MNKNRHKIKLSYNSPVMLSFTILAFIVTIVGIATGGTATSLLFSTYRSSLLNPLYYVRLFTHILGHAGLSHYFGNFMYILLIGPMLEEKYGSKKLLYMILFTAGITGIINSIFFPNVMLCGASGIVFMLILLSSFAGAKEKEGIPLTVILVAVLYLGNEILNGIFSNDDISQLAHLIGGACGGIFGYLLRPKKTNSYTSY